MQRLVNMKTSDDLEMIVCGAHVAGCMETEGLIDTGTDMELMEFLVEIYNEYCKAYEMDISFAEYAETRLLEKFAISDIDNPDDWYNWIPSAHKEN